MRKPGTGTYSITKRLIRTAKAGDTRSMGEKNSARRCSGPPPQAGAMGRQDAERNDSRYSFLNGKIFDSLTEEWLPTDEPVIVIRASDPCSYFMVRRYLARLNSPRFKSQTPRSISLRKYVQNRLRNFTEF